MFSQTSEYALRVIVYLASLDGKPATIPRIAAATRTPEGYLAKVLRGLCLPNSSVHSAGRRAARCSRDRRSRSRCTT